VQGSKRNAEVKQYCRFPNKKYLNETESKITITQ
jgi:hypothetical protein